MSRARAWASGDGDVDAKTRAKAAAAIAQWEKKKAKAKSDNKVAASNVEFIDDGPEDRALALAATFEDCSSRGIVGLSREYKERVRLSDLVARKSK